jgi:hypothetical protein
MSRIDERLTQRFRRAERPVPLDGLFENVDERRGRRIRARKVGVVVLATIVLLGTTGGVWVLSRVFPQTQPLAAQPTNEPSPEQTGGPSQTPSPSGPVVPDLRLGFPTCNVSSVTGFFQDKSTKGTAYVATKKGDVGRCPQPDDSFNVIAVDLDDDGLADLSYGPIECMLECRVFAAPDLNDDGVAELLVVQQGGSVPGLRPYAVSRDGDEDGRIVPVEVGGPGDAAGGYEPGEQPRLFIGGDGFGHDALRCEDGPDGRVLIATSATQEPPDRINSVWRAHETTFVFEGGNLVVVGTRDFEEPVEGDPSFRSGEDLCGAPLPSFFTGK